MGLIYIDPRLSLLEYSTNSGTSSSSGTIKNKDGILFMFNMHRPILHSPLRRRPSRRHFTATSSEEGYGEWPGLSNLSDFCSELTTRLTLSVPETLRSAFSIDKDTKRTAIEPVEKLPEEWFQDTATAVPAIQQVYTVYSIYICYSGGYIQSCIYIYTTAVISGTCI